MIYELISKTSREVSHGTLNSFSSSPLSEHIQPAQNQGYRWLISLFSNFLFFIGLQTATIIKPEYFTMLSHLMSGFSSSVSLLPCFCLMKCNKTFLKVMWEMHVSCSNTYKLEAQNIPFFFFSFSKVTSSSMGNYLIFKLQ